MNKILHYLFKLIAVITIAFFFVEAFSTQANAAILYEKHNDSTGIIQLEIRDTNLTKKLVMCYPNPATTYINFKFDNTVSNTSKLYIYSFVGKNMNEINITNNVIKISLENYFRGLYVYQLREANGTILESGKFQVKN